MRIPNNKAERNEVFEVMGNTQELDAHKSPSLDGKYSSHSIPPWEMKLSPVQMSCDYQAEIGAAVTRAALRGL